MRIVHRYRFSSNYILLTMMAVLLLLLVTSVLLVIQGERTPDLSEWDRIKLLTRSELKSILITASGKEESEMMDLDENELQELAYDEDTIESWDNYLKEHPEVQKKIEDGKVIPDKEKYKVIKKMKKAGLSTDDVNNYSAEQMKSLDSFINSGALKKSKESNDDAYPANGYDEL